MPEAPLNREELRGKFMPLVRDMGAEGEKIFDHLAALETRSLELETDAPFRTCIPEFA